MTFPVNCTHYYVLVSETKGTFMGAYHTPKFSKASNPREGNPYCTVEQAERAIKSVYEIWRVRVKIKKFELDFASLEARIQSSLTPVTDSIIARHVGSHNYLE